MSQQEEIEAVLNRMMKRLDKMPTKGDLAECIVLSCMAILAGVVWAMILIK
jgi:hypothetical protein